MFLKKNCIFFFSVSCLCDIQLQLGVYESNINIYFFAWWRWFCFIICTFLYWLILKTTSIFIKILLLKFWRGEKERKKEKTKQNTFDPLLWDIWQICDVGPERPGFSWSVNATCLDLSVLICKRVNNSACFWGLLGGANERMPVRRTAQYLAPDEFNTH